jgi:small subunit ribosomal protein S15
MLDAAEKKAITERYQRGAEDTGSPEVQIAVLSTRIAQLTRHLNQFKKDFHSRRGLYVLVSRRKRLMRYLQKTNPTRYREVIAELGIRG